MIFVDQKHNPAALLAGLRRSKFQSTAFMVEKQKSTQLKKCFFFFATYFCLAANAEKYHRFLSTFTMASLQNYLLAFNQNQLNRLSSPFKNLIVKIPG